MPRQLTLVGHYRRRAAERALLNLTDRDGRVFGVQVDLSELERMSRRACDAGCSRCQSGPVVVTQLPMEADRCSS